MKNMSNNTREHAKLILSLRENVVLQLPGKGVKQRKNTNSFGSEWNKERKVQNTVKLKKSK